jgi:hypothetical protein
MVLVPPIFVSTGTLVPAIDPEELLDPRQLLKLVDKLGLPPEPFQPAVSLAHRLGFPRRPALLPLELLHELGVIPHPHRFLADSAYLPLKELHDCWVEPLAQLGLASREHSLAAARTKLRALIKCFPGCKVILVGQSQGGLIVLELAMDEEFRSHIATVVVAGTPIQGVPKLDELPLKWATAFPGVAQMTCQSPSLENLRCRVASDWPVDVPVNLMGAPDDRLVPLESALTLRLPDGVRQRRYLIGPDRPDEADGMEYLMAPPGLSHLRMCRRPSAVALVRELRDQYTIKIPNHPELKLVAA